MKLELIATHDFDPQGFEPIPPAISIMVHNKKDATAIVVLGVQEQTLAEAVAALKELHEFVGRFLESDPAESLRFDAERGCFCWREE